MRSLSHAGGVCAVVCCFAWGCGGSRAAAPQNQNDSDAGDARVRALADSYLAGFFERNPDAATLFGVPGAHHDKLPDNSFAALNAWHAREDAWLAQAKAIDPASIGNSSTRATYAIVREALEASIGARTCRYELWTVSQFVNAWQVQFGYLVTIQPVGSEAARRASMGARGGVTGKSMPGRA
jgi:uncharacterized protein (DUF885 family)